MADSVRTLKLEAEDREMQKMSIFNPLAEDFTVKYGDVSYTIFSNNLAEFPIEIAEHVKKHLITHILNKKNNFSETSRQQAEKMVTV